MNGASGRLWLSLKRPEYEHPYLRHQAKALRNAHPDRLLQSWDRIPGSTFYDHVQLRVRSDLLWPAYEILYPRDKLQISARALRMAGMDGFVALWCDNGTRRSARADVVLKHTIVTPEEATEWCQSLGLAPTAVKRPRERQLLLQWHGAAAQGLMKTLRPLVHRSMRRTLWPPSESDPSLYA
ncbi:MAG: hypothetical protein VKI63_06100 [Cyanobium sp.]|nr:hypothetical protein [Cyanobium sp.]